MNWFNSESALVHLILSIDTVLGIVELVLAVLAVKYAHKEPSPNQKRKLEIFTSWVALILAFLVLFNAFGWWRYYALEDVAEVQREKESQARIQAAVEKSESPRHISDNQVQYAHELLGKYPGTSFMLEVFPGFDGTRFGSQLEAVLLACGWNKPGNFSNIGSQQFVGGKPFEPVGVEIIATQPDQLYAASALKVFLDRCEIKSRMTLNSNPPVMIKAPLLYIQIGSKN